MSTLSEAAYLATWMEGLEFAIWRRVEDGAFKYSQFGLTAVHRQHLITLSDACGGWIIFHDSLDIVFVAVDEWLQIVENNRSSRADLASSIS